MATSLASWPHTNAGPSAVLLVASAAGSNDPGIRLVVDLEMVELPGNKAILKHACGDDRTVMVGYLVCLISADNCYRVKTSKPVLTSGAVVRGRRWRWLWRRICASIRYTIRNEVRTLGE